MNQKQFPKADNSCFRNIEKLKRDGDAGDGGGSERDKRVGTEKTLLFDSRNQENNFPPRVNNRI